MKVIKLLFIVALTGNVCAARSQEVQITKKDSIVSSSWIFGLGLNAVDDAGSEFKDVFNFEENWNVVPFPSRLSIGKYFRNGLGLEAVGTYNQYQEGKRIDGDFILENIDYYAFDFRASYDLNRILGQTGWFDPYVGIGVGYTEANNTGRGTYNAAVGFRTWFSDRVGLDFNSTGKWAMNIENGVTNHIQHAVGVVYQFGIEKELSSRGMEKLALLKKIEAEQQRVQDSIAAANQAELEAKELAERLKREEEAALLNSQEKKRLAQENSKQNLIEKEIKALGNVYFGLNSSYLSKNDTTLLDKLVEILNDNPTLVIKITSHTDSRGTDTYNLWLSERRLNRTLSYLSEKVVVSNRILSEAKGETNLVNECDDNTHCLEDQHSINRRCEFIIIY